MRSAWWKMRSHSLRPSCPWESLRQSSLASAASSRSASWSEGISSEKKATFLPLRPALAATLRAKAVLPTEGRAAMMVSEPGCRPRVFLSSEAKPVGTPVMKDFPSATRFWIASRFSTAAIIGSLMRRSVSTDVPWAAPKTSCWAVSRKDWTLAPDS